MMWIYPRAVALPSRVSAVTTHVGRWLRTLRPSVILALAWSLFVAYAYPGLMSMDSFDQLEEARAWFFTDSHPPAMAALWGIVDRIVPGPFGMLLLQSIAFLIGLYLILRRVANPRAAALLTCLVFLFPPVFAPLVVIWKDCLMAGFLLLGIAALFDERRYVRVLGLAALCAATAMRYNAFAATFPLVMMLFEWEPGKRWLTRYAIAAGAWLAITLLAFGLNAALTDRKMFFWYSTFGLADIAGTLANVDETVPDAELGPLLVPTEIKTDHDFQAALRARYRPDTFGQLIGGDSPLWSVPIRGTTPAPEAQREAIGKAWREILTAHPGAYVRYRFQVFAEALGLTDRFGGGSVMRRHWQIPERLQSLGVASGSSWYQKAVEKRLVRLGKNTGLFRPYAYVLLALALLAFCRRQRDVLAILASGLLMELSLLPLSGTPDLRYSHWLVVCACLGVVMLVARRSHEAT